MKKIYSIFILTFIFINLRAVTLIGDSITISLLTCNSGEELYSSFGHSGIRIIDKYNKRDNVFNYGTFNFNEPGFYVNFVRGYLKYYLDYDSYSSFYDQYEFDKREIRELVLNLSSAQKEKILYFLINNSKEENKYYKYDFFWDNCSTRILGVFTTNLKSDLVLNTSNFDTTITLKQCLMPYVSKFNWIPYSFDLILGMPCEKKATAIDQSFLPDNLEKIIAQSSIIINNQVQPLLAEKNLLLKGGSLKSGKSIFTPMFVNLLLLLFVIIIMFFEQKRKLKMVWLDRFLFFISGFLGLFFIFMWLGTEHYSTPRNLNILWLFPFNLIIAFLIKLKNNSNLKFYFMITLFINAFILLFFKWFPQELNLAFIPLILVLSLRYLQQLNPRFF